RALLKRVAGFIGRHSADSDHEIVATRESDRLFMANRAERVLTQFARRAAQDGGMILAPSESAHALAAGKRTKALTVLYRAQIAGEVLGAGDFPRVLFPYVKRINASQRREDCDDQSARAA